jgi:hypothetical protein
VARISNTTVFGVIAIIIGAKLVLGGLMFLVAASLMSDFPRLILIPPILQIVLGLIASMGGLLLIRGHRVAKVVLAIVAIGVIANFGFLAIIGFSIISS